MSVADVSNEYFHESDTSNKFWIIWNDHNEWIRPCTPNSNVRPFEPKAPRKPQRNLEHNGSSQRRISRAKRSIAADLNAVINRYQLTKSRSRNSAIDTFK
uniref:WWE domain-containing protein n=1 Tax=Parascaris univalens TaxID=6257 RepID=A0A914ZJ87_PARUN